MPRLLRLPALLTGAALLVPGSALPQATLPDDFVDVRIASGLDSPVGFAFVPDPPPRAGRRVVVIEQYVARLRLFVDGLQLPGGSIGVVPDVRTDYYERGLLGIAFDPRWPAAPYVYLHYTAFGGHVKVTRYTLLGDIAFTGTGVLLLDPTSAHDLLTDVPDNAVNHQGGTVRFGPDSLLYASFGEDADACAAQDTTSFKGAIVRMDVRGLSDGPGVASQADLVPAINPFANHADPRARLVVALGLRNPFRFHVDQDGRMFIADVGATSWEEVDVVMPGANCGWPRFEAFSLTGQSCGGPVPLTFPVCTYDHSQGQAIVGLGVCRRAGAGPYRFPAQYEGNYFFGDYYSGMIRRLAPSGGGWALTPAPGQPSFVNWGEQAQQVSDAQFGPDGALWYVRQGVNYGNVTGELRAIRYTGLLTAPAPGAEVSRVALGPPVPNPARGSARLAVRLAQAGRVRLDVLDAQGRVVRLLLEGERPAGEFAATWDGRDDASHAAPAGLYFVRLHAAGRAHVQRLALAR